MAGLLDKRLWIVSGKGGVGKSTIAAALALRSARAGRRTLVCEVNTQERISRLLGHPPAGPEVTQLEDNLWAVDVRPQEAMREYALMVLRFETLYKTVFENRVVRYFLRFIPSLQELVMLGKILFHLQEKLPDGRWRFDTIVMDAPATGHAITFLAVPQVLLQHACRPAPMTREAHEDARPRWWIPQVTAAVLVSLPEELPVNETLELHAALQRAGADPHARGGAQRGLPRALHRGRPGGAGGPAGAARGWRRPHHDRASQTVLGARRSWSATCTCRCTTVPRLFTPDFGRAGHRAGDGTPRAAGDGGEREHDRALPRRSRQKRVLVCVGSGGVGKTTVAATLALRAAVDGRGSLVCTIDPAKRLANSLGLHGAGQRGGARSPRRRWSRWA